MHMYTNNKQQHIQLPSTEPTVISGPRNKPLLCDNPRGWSTV